MGRSVIRLEGQLYGETFTTAAFSLNVWVPELETFIQPLFDVIHFCSVDVNQTFGINEDINPLAIKQLIFWRRLIHWLKDVH